MTQEELDALPETGGYGRETRIIDGHSVFVPVAQKAFALWAKEDEPTSATDIHGQRWLLGWHDGIRYKSRMGQV